MTRDFPSLSPSLGKGAQVVSRNARPMNSESLLMKNLEGSMDVNIEGRYEVFRDSPSGLTKIY